MNVASFRWLLIVAFEIIYFVDANWITGNLCWSMPCMNGGSCYGSAYTYLCVCPINYSGSLCEKRLGICQESPCGNRGLCVETGLTSFECRCYFDYMGPLCEEHVAKNDPTLWSSLIPVHTRVLFDILQEAYRSKTTRKPTNDTDNIRLDFVGPLPTDHSFSSTTTNTTLQTTSVTYPSETTEVELVIQADGIQLENIFPDISTMTTSDQYTEDFTADTSQTSETTENNQDNNETISSTASESNMPTTSMVDTIEDTTAVSTEENMMTTSFEEDQTSSDTSEPSNTMLTSPPMESSSDNSESDTITTTSSTDLSQDPTEQIEDYNDSTDSEDGLLNTSTKVTEYSAIQTDDNPSNSSQARTTSTTTDQSFTIENQIDSLNISQVAHNQLLVKLCQQLLSHILPNASSLSSSSAVETALSLTSSSSSTSNSSANALLNWIKGQLVSSTTTTTAASSSSTPLPALLIGGKKLPSIPLQRVDMDEALLDSER